MPTNTPFSPPEIHISNDTSHVFLFDPIKFIQIILELKNVTSGYFDFSFIDNARIQEINVDYLSHNYPTDVISFNLEETGQPIIGNIYISIEQAEENAPEFNHSLEEEIQLLIIHGLLHVLGYKDSTPDHKKRMNDEQFRLLDHYRNQHSKEKRS